MHPASEPIGRKSNSSIAIGSFLFLGGLVMLFGTYFTGAPIAIPMMIVGLAYPLIHSYMVKHGSDWEETGKNRPVLMSRKEGRRLVKDQAGDRYESGQSQYNIISRHYASDPQRLRETQR